MHKSNRFCTWVTCKRQENEKGKVFAVQKWICSRECGGIFTPTRLPLHESTLFSTVAQSILVHTKGKKATTAGRGDGRSQKDKFSCRHQNIGMWSIRSVPARDVAAPHFVAFPVIHNGLLDLVELLWELLMLIKAPASQADVHSRIRCAALVGQNGTSDVAVAVERTLDFNHCHIKILREKAVIKFADAFVCLKLSNNPDIPQN